MREERLSNYGGEHVMSTVTPAPVRVVSPRTALIRVRRFVIDAPLPLASARARLAAAIEPEQLQRSAGARPFEGRLDETSFEIWRIIGYRNSVRPVIRGRLVSAGDTTRVDGTITLSPLPLPARIFTIILVWRRDRRLPRGGVRVRDRRARPTAHHPVCDAGLGRPHDHRPICIRVAQSAPRARSAVRYGGEGRLRPDYVTSTSAYVD